MLRSATFIATCLIYNLFIALIVSVLSWQPIPELIVVVSFCCHLLRKRCFWLLLVFWRTFFSRNVFHGYLLLTIWFLFLSFWFSYLLNNHRIIIPNPRWRAPTYIREMVWCSPLSDVFRLLWETKDRLVHSNRSSSIFLYLELFIL